MKFVPRGIKVRSLIILIALVAFGLAYAKDRPIRQLRNGYLDYAAHDREQARKHERGFFDALSRIDTPYPKVERQSLYVDQLAEWPLSNHFRSWETEAAWHRQMTVKCRQNAAEFDRQSEVYRDRLVIPWF